MRVKLSTILLYLSIAFSICSCFPIAKYYPGADVPESEAAIIRLQSGVYASVWQIKNNRMQELGSIYSSTKMLPGNYKLSVSFNKTGVGHSLSPVGLSVSLEKGKTYYLFTKHETGVFNDKWKPVFSEKKPSSLFSLF